jgi:hypothetical protein
VKPKAFIGAVVGAGIGSAAWYGLVTHGVLRETSWIPILIGTLTGVGAWLLAEPIAHAWQRGAVVAGIALAAAYFTQQGTSYALEHGFESSFISFDEIFFPDAPLPEPPASQHRAEPATWNPSPPRLSPVADRESVPTAEPREEPIVPDASTSELPDTPPPELRLTRPPDADPAAAAAAPHAETQERPVAADKSMLQLNDVARLQQLPYTVTAGEGRNPPMADQGTLVALSYAIGTLVAYLLGRGREIRAEPKEMASSPA